MLFTSGSGLNVVVEQCLYFSLISMCILFCYWHVFTLCMETNFHRLMTDREFEKYNATEENRVKYTNYILLLVCFGDLDFTAKKGNWSLKTRQTT